MPIYRRRIRKGNIRTISEYIFFAIWVLGGHLVILCGRGVYYWLFANKPEEGGFQVTSFSLTILFLATLIFAAMRTAKLRLRQKMLIGLSVAFVSALFMQLVAAQPSFLGCTLHFYYFFCCLVPVGLNECFAMKMEKEFWSTLYDYMVKMLWYFMALYLASVALLRYIHTGRALNDEFLADLLTVSAVFVLSFMLIAFWVMTPTWQNVLSGYRIREAE